MATIKPTTVPSKRLAASITAASLTIQLNNILGWDGVALTSSDFGTKLYCVLRNDSNTLMEIMELDPSTIASASITVLLRGLKFTGDLTTEVTANKLTWVKNETIVELGTDVPQLLKHYVDIIDAQTIAGVKTFSVAPKSSVAAVTSTELVRKAELDAAALGSITNAPVVVPGNGGEVLTIDQLVYLDSADQEWKLCDADIAGSVENVILGITRGAGTDGGAIANGVTIFGEHEAASAIFTAGKVFASNTAGGFATSAGTKEVPLGIAISTTKIDFSPRFEQQITEDEQDAISGTDGTPSASNKLQTASGAQKGTPVYAASAVGTDSYAITVTPAIAAYVTGMKFRFLADVANTGACTLAVSGLSALDIKKKNDQALATGDIEAGQIVEVVYDGTDFQMQSQLASSEFFQADIQTFTTVGADTWTKPTTGTPKKVLVQVWGGGGSGAFEGSNGNASGGGGAGYAEKWFEASNLAATETIAVAAGGASVSSQSDGNVGGDSTFGASGTLVTAYGGGAGHRGTGGTTSTGGGGGNALGVGGVGLTDSDTSNAGSPGTPLAGSGHRTVQATLNGLYGAAGGAGGNSALNGGNAYYGGGGGGGYNNGTGGTSKLGGNGGAGAATGAATAGSVPGGGGGGSVNGASGKGGDGKVIVTTFF